MSRGEDIIIFVTFSLQDGPVTRTNINLLIEYLFFPLIRDDISIFGGTLISQ